MIYSKEINRRSPLRVFERSIHGGLGPGNLGLVMSRAGVGKTAFLIGIALDDLMRDREVLHVNTENSTEKVRAFYDEVFRDLAESSGMEDRASVHLRVERNRMIHTFRDGFNLERIRAALGYMHEHLSFEPATLIIDGFPDWDHAEPEALASLKALAQELSAEIWLSAQTHRDGEERDRRGVPRRIARFDDFLSVIVKLRPEGDHIRLDLYKDHENTDLADLHIELDPKTLLLKWR